MDTSVFSETKRQDDNRTETFGWTAANRNLYDPKDIVLLHRFPRLTIRVLVYLFLKWRCACKRPKQGRH